MIPAVICDFDLETNLSTILSDINYHLQYISVKWIDTSPLSKD